MKCPNCGDGLQATEYEGIPIETCSGCGGEWLDAIELYDVTVIREERFSEEELEALAAATPSECVKLTDVDRNLVCPKCGGTTDPINYGGTSGIIIDRCTDCTGFWLDASELEKVQMLVEGWEDQLEGDLAVHSARLHDIVIEVDKKDDVTVSRIPGVGRLINAFVNGVLDFVP